MKKIKYLIVLIIVGLFCTNLLMVDASNNVLLNIESPINNITDNTLSISGWVMSNTSNVVKVYLDGNEINDVFRVPREDVLKVVKGYGDITTNKLPGFNKTVDISNYSDGLHNLTVRVFNDNLQMLAEENRKIIVKKYKSLINIEEPSLSVNSDSLLIGGWIMSNSPNTQLNIYLDDTRLSNIDRLERNDVLKVITGYGDYNLNKMPGFRKVIDTSKMIDGKHTLKVELIDLNTQEVITEKALKFVLKKYKYKMNLEEPSISNISGTSLKIGGWFLASSSSIGVKAYIDDFMIESFDRENREDVLKNISGYGSSDTNKMPGFKKIIDLSLFDDGKHLLKIQLINNVTKEVLSEEKKYINLQKYKSRLFIEEPSVSVIDSNSLTVSGWLMSKNSRAGVQIFVDDREIHSITRLARQDVLNAIKEYGDSSINKNPGFKSIIDMSDLKDGLHNIKVRVIDLKDKTLICEQVKEIVLRKYKTKLNVEEPIISDISGDRLVVSGWAISSDKNSDIKIIFDEKEIANINRIERLDVIRSFSGYGNSDINERPGFSTIIDLSKINDGNHNIKVLVFDSITGEELASYSKNIKLKKFKTTGFLEEPKKDVKIDSKLNISFWLMSTVKNREVKLFIDNNEVIDANISTFSRRDVFNAVKGYGDNTINKDNGYSIEVDMNAYKDGNHNIEIRLLNSETGEINFNLTRDIKLKKYDGKFFIDSPELNYFSSSIDIEGWEMSDIDSSYIKIYIDDIEVDPSLERIARRDVLNALKDQYGGEKMNPLPGFKGNIDLENIKDGNHTLSFKLYSKYGDVLSSYKNNICVRECLPEYYTQTDIRWANMVYGLSTMAKTGCAPTAISMAFSTILGKKILPTDIANYLYYNTFEFNRKNKGTSGLGIIYAANYFKVKYTPITSKKELINELSDGKIVFAAMGNGKFATPFYNHAIILYGYNKGDTYAYDPLKVSNNGEVSIDTIFNEQSRDPDDSLGGANFYSLVGYY